MEMETVTDTEVGTASQSSPSLCQLRPQPKRAHQAQNQPLQAQTRNPSRITAAIPITTIKQPSLKIKLSVSEQ